MLQSVNLPLCRSTAEEYGGWQGVEADAKALGLDGVEGIWAGEEVPADFPPSLLTGYHLTFYADWLDFYREDRAALCRKCGSVEAARAFYGDLGPDSLRRLFREDLARARSLGTRYVVFHVSDISIEECYTYKWLHSNEEIIDAALEVIGDLLRDVPPDFEFLVENQWWPGFTFTDPRQTARLLDGIPFERKGIMLDTGHLLNGNPALTTEREGVDYILRLVEAHGSLSDHIRGLHFHQSLSGAYVRTHTGFLPALPETLGEQFAQCYAHIQRIDRHQPWTDPASVRIIERIRPAYLTHELAVPDRAARFRAVQTQRETLRRGGLC